ncbi:Tartrate-resistant acid phosphatase type 5 [Aphelenchoides besseyi]|nr:Tartrate-resistant acid phosphatase type 5 [Aphelenchoides besseyi]KAI6216243.1 Tartrate-resistant acid phosphatase type 5 [Aphelenchoides besseyi]
MLEFWVLVVLIVEVQAVSEGLTCTRGSSCHVKKDHLDVFVIGDTGGIAFDVGKLSISKPTHIQLKVADSMVKLAEQEDLDMIVNVGDNKVFEEPYNNSRLQVPWFMVAGNHDHLGNVEAQIAYTDRSNKWTFPSLYYKTSYSFGPKGTRVEFVFIDTVVLCGNSNNVKSRSIFSWIGVKTRIPERPAAKYVDESKKQWKWIEEQLRTSTADHLFVVGHYPIHSVVTKTLQCLKRELDPLMRKYKVGAYFAGHNHNLQYFRDSKPQDEWQMRFPKLLESPIASELGVGEGGFVQLRIEPKNARLRFYARDLQMEHEDLIPNRQ